VEFHDLQVFFMWYYNPNILLVYKLMFPHSIHNLSLTSSLFHNVLDFEIWEMWLVPTPWGLPICYGMMFLMCQWPSFNTLNPILQKCPCYMIHICDTMKDAGLEVRSSQVLILDPSRYVLVKKEQPPFPNWVARCKPIKLHILLLVKDWKKHRIRFDNSVCG